MKNIFKAFIFLILTFALCIPMQMVVKASTYTNMITKNEVVVSKPWTVSFNKPLSAITVTKANIKVVGANNEDIPINVTLANSNKNVIVAAVKNYETNKTYTLIVTKNVKSYDGTPLPKEVRMVFNTVSAPTKPSEFTVCIDPAQYYKEITGINGAKAKDINLNTALKLGEILRARGFNVVFTRTSDSVPWDKLGEDDAKAAIAKSAEADVFLSINTNFHTTTTANGIETYYLSEVSNKNKMLSGFIQDELIKATDANDRGIKEGVFEILKKTSCPTAVVELGFLSNPVEEILLSKPEYQYNEAKAIANGLMNYTGFANTDTNYNPIFQISSVQDIMANVEAGDTYTFPKTVQAIMSNNSTKWVGVEWSQSTVSRYDLGTYIYEGIITNYNTKVKAIINITKKTYTVVLDAGHGGYDPGAIGPTGIQEKNVVLPITLKIGDILVKNGVETIYTRTIDQYKTLDERTTISNNANPDYFVSIHSNGSTSTTPSGIETYSFYGNVAGAKLAQAVQTELINATGRNDRGTRTAGYYVLANSDATAILVETSFTTNTIEEKLLNTLAYQFKLALAIATGILKSLGITNIVY